MTDTSIRVSSETRRELNKYRAMYDITQDEAIRRLLEYNHRIEYPCVTVCDGEKCDVELAYEHPPRDYDNQHVYCMDCEQKHRTCQGCSEEYLQDDDGANIHYCPDCREMVEEKSDM